MNNIKTKYKFVNNYYSNDSLDNDVNYLVGVENVDLVVVASEVGKQMVPAYAVRDHVAFDVASLEIVEILWVHVS